MKNINYDIPQLKKQQSRNKQNIEDLQAKAQKICASSDDHKRQFRQECDDLGIQGIDIEAEVVCVAQELLPKVYTGVAETCCSKLQPAVAFYKAWLQAAGIGAEANVLPALDFVVRHGNGTVCEYRRFQGLEEPDLSVHEACAAPTLSQSSELQGTSPEIDWGDLDAPLDLPPDADPTPVLSGKGHVQALPTHAVEGPQGPSAEIAWGDIDAVDEALDFGGAEDVQIELVGEGTVWEASPPADDAAALLQCPVLTHDETRNEFLNNALELAAFLMERGAQHLKERDTCIFVAPVAPCPEPEREDMHNALQKVIQTLTSKSVRKYILLQSSHSYRDRCAASLRHRLQVIARCKATLDSLTDKQQQLDAAIAEGQEAMAATIANIKRTQRDVEQCISELSDGRRVYLIEDINKL